MLTKDQAFVKKKYNKMWFWKNYTTICSVLIYFSFPVTTPNYRKLCRKNHKKTKKTIKKAGQPSPCLEKQP